MNKNQYRIIATLIAFAIMVVVAIVFMSNDSTTVETSDNKEYTKYEDENEPSNSEEVTKAPDTSAPSESIDENSAPNNEPTKVEEEPEITKEPSPTEFIESSVEPTDEPTVAPTEEAYEYVKYTFANQKLLDQHYEKHGIEMGFASAEDYEKAACDVVNNPAALHKIEAEDGDDVYYIEDTNEFVVVSTYGYIRTYFNPSSGKKYYDRQ